MTGFRYFRPLSLTWWAGLALILLGIAAIHLPDAVWMTEYQRLISLLISGGASEAPTSPGVMMFTGVGMIGLGDKIERKT